MPTTESDGSLKAIRSAVGRREIVVFEHVCGGGVWPGPLSAELTRQAQAILRHLVQGFLALGGRVSTCVDGRLAEEEGPAKRLLLEGAVADVERGIDVDPQRLHVLPVDQPSRVGAVFDALARQAGLAIVVAPCQNRALTRWLARLDGLGVPSLNARPEAAELCCDKQRLIQHLQQAGVAVPPLQDPETAELEHPCVLKPRWGDGCERTRRVPAGGQVPPGLRRGRILQREVFGTAASVTFLIHGSRRRALPAGWQVIEARDGRLSYEGGILPLDPALQQRARVLGEQTLDAVPGLHGYVGVDLVLGDEPSADWVIEVNPRVTMSLVGLQRLCRDALLGALLEPEVELSWWPGPVRFGPAGEVRALDGSGGDSA